MLLRRCVLQLPLSLASLTTSFFSRPDLEIPLVRITSPNTGDVSPGYWIISTWGGAGQLAPYIFDANGQLVWSGFVSDSPDTGYYNLRIYDFADAPSLMSVIAGNSLDGQGRGYMQVLDGSYRIVKTFGELQPGKELDFHLAQLSANGETAFVGKLEREAGAENRLVSSVIEQRRFDNGDTVRQWRATDHGVSASESFLPPGTGQDSREYDFLHFNSLDQFANGDLLVSARNADTIYRVSNETGEVIWRLGGRNSTFTQHGFELRGQHDVRIRPENENHISVYNNNWHYNEHGTPSALLIQLDLVHMTAKVIHEWKPANARLTARHSGSVQILENSNVLVGWGAHAGFTEFTENGSRLVEGEFADANTLVYRVEKNAWVGRPTTRPDLYIISRPSENPGNVTTSFYMSWNGATQVFTWNVYSVQSKSPGRRDVELLGNVKRIGFETHFEALGLITGGFVEALDINGSPLSRSKTVSTILAEPSGPASGSSQDTVAYNGRRSKAGAVYDFLMLMPILLSVVLVGAGIVTVLQQERIETELNKDSNRDQVENIPLMACNEGGEDV
ncbi:hypothetical protein AC578_8330 [Pseudocercospora eumusae]|uniref:Arylsulfotransferase N-terminal domain-containing protein n=1 Tax=Pseudocercospora eumusae TaxID=321146 RepID=A0A139GWB5_9PEZI|nr:hypothetical protein AC578_8330 [Pseudocercospora eumusae]